VTQAGRDEEVDLRAGWEGEKEEEGRRKKKSEGPEDRNVNFSPYPCET